MAILTAFQSLQAFPTHLTHSPIPLLLSPSSSQSFPKSIGQHVGLWPATLVFPASVSVLQTQEGPPKFLTLSRSLRHSFSFRAAISSVPIASPSEDRGTRC